MIDLYPSDTAAPPALFTAAELRAQCRVDTADDDAKLLEYEAAARRHVENITSRRLTSRALVASAESWSDFRIVTAPVSAIAAITYTDAAGTPQALAPGDYVNRPRFELPIIRLAKGVPAPELGDDPLINITMTAGYAAGACPADLKQAVLMLVAHWYSNREAVLTGTISVEVDLAVKALTDLNRLTVLV